MNNLGLLLKVQFQSLILRTSTRKNRKKAVAGISTLLILAAAFMYMSVVYVSGMVMAFPSGVEYIALYVMGVMTIFMLLVFGYQSAGGHLFRFKDYDMLMSLPVKKSEVLMSKFLSFLLLEYFYGFFLLVPSIVIVGIKCHFGFMYYLIGIISWILLPLVPMVLASLLSYLSMYLAGKFKYKNLMNNIFYIVLMALVFVLIFYYQSLLNKDVTQLIQILDNIDRYFPFVSYLFNGMIFQNYGQFAIGMMINLGALGLFIQFFSKNFMKLNGEIKSGYKVKNYQLEKSKATSAFNALVKKEIRTYFSNTVYFMNTAVMPVLMILGFGYVSFFKKEEMATIVLMFDGVIIPIFCGAILLLALMSCTTNSSISLEGKNFDTLKSFPVKTFDIFMAKITLNMLVILPCALICSLLAMVSLNLTFVDFLLCVVTSLTSGLFISSFGLVLNLHFYRLDWENSAVIVKQSMPVLITTLGGMVVGMGAIMLGVFLLDYTTPTLIVAGLNGILILLDIVLFAYLRNGGVKQFNKIH